jgi:CheY-like chemotaxis protein
MSSHEEFVSLVKDALGHLYDYHYLDSHPLALQHWPQATRQGGTRAERFNRLLLESIEELNPPGAPSKDTSRARYYSLLIYRYVEEWALADIMRELGFSRSQFFREQRKAIAMLASNLRRKLPQEAVSGEGLAQTPPTSVHDDGLTVEADRVLAQREAVDPVHMVQGVLQVVSKLAEQYGVKLESDLAPGLPSIYGGRVLLRQVILRGLSNLISHPGTRQVCIHMEHVGPQVVADLVTQSGLPGSGSGSAADHPPPDMEAVRRLVELMDGQWGGIEPANEGFRCRFGLPAHDKKVILVVDDNEGIIRVFRGYLDGYEYQVVGATTGEDALQRAREFRPTAITLDIMMPSQDGWEILQTLKDDPVTQGIPVIVCSVLEDPQLARSLGAAAYLRKPVAQADLLVALGRLADVS